MKTEHIIIVGAGIVGAASALWLKRAGHEVTLIDKGAPGMGASYGNGCLLASCAMVPVTTPGLIPKGPKYLLDSKFPLFMRWGYTPKLLPWLMKYLSHANDSDTRRIAKSLTHIVGDSVEQHQALTADTPADFEEAPWPRTPHPRLAPCEPRPPLAGGGRKSCACGHQGPWRGASSSSRVGW